MVLSKHALVRGKQRGISSDTIELILSYGTPEPKPGNALEYKVRKKDKSRILSRLKRQIKLLELSTRKAVLVSDEGTVITTYNVL